LESQQSYKVSHKEAPVSEQADMQPKGIGMAVAFDWGLAVQVLVTPFVTLFLGEPGMLKSFKLNPVMNTTVSFLLSLPFVALLAIFGEGVRRGWHWTRRIQVGFNTLGFFGGFFSLYNVWQGSKQGNYWGVVTSTILLIFSPLIAWRMSRPSTKKWFATVTSSDARARHSGAWPLLILLWSIVGGVLQAIAALVTR
jgi:hypothetical protein